MIPYVVVWIATTERRPILLLAFAHLGDELLQTVELEDAGEDLIADDKAGCAAYAESIGQRAIGFQRLGNLRRGHVVLQAVEVKTDLARDPEHGLVGDMAVRRYHRLVKGVVFALLARRQRGMRRRYRGRSEHRQFLVDKAEPVTLAQQLFQRGLLQLAIGTAVIEELDEADIALWIAADRARRIVIDFAAIPFERLRRLVVGAAAELVLGFLRCLGLYRSGVNLFLKVLLLGS